MSLFAHVQTGVRVRPALPADAQPVLDFLARDSAENVFLTHLILRHGLAHGPGSRDWYVARDDGEVRGACTTRGNLVPAAADEDVARALARAVGTIRPGTLSLVGERSAVNAMWERLRRRAPTVRLVREEQPFYVIGRGAGDGDTRGSSALAHRPAGGAAFELGPGLGLRLARGDDLDLLVHACADMLREEILDDPCSRDPVGFRAQVWRMIRERSIYVLEAERCVVFKAHANVRTPGAVQVSGVYTLPDQRGKGYATAAMAAVVRELLRHHLRVCLYVNRGNVAAIRTYEAAGFRRTGTFKSIFFDRGG